MDMSFFVIRAFSGNLRVYGRKPHFRWIANAIEALVRAGVTEVIAVFDGPAHALKAAKLGMSRRAKTFLQRHVESAKVLLDQLAIQYIDADHDAEAACASLNRQGMVHAVLTDDFDTFLYGGKNVYKGFRICRGVPKATSYRQEDILQTLRVSLYGLVVSAVLAGTDFNIGQMNVGPKKALEKVRQRLEPEFVSAVEATKFIFDNDMTFNGGIEAFHIFTADSESIDTKIFLQMRSREVTVWPAPLDIMIQTMMPHVGLTRATAIAETVWQYQRKRYPTRQNY